jgi:hypothetical protein
MTKFKIFIILLFVALLSNISYSQVIAILRQPPPFQFKASDLWKVNITNTGPAVDIYLKGTVKKSTTMLVEATSASFTLPTTIAPMMVNAASISPIDLKKYSSEIDDAFKSTGSLPSGKYTICIYAYSKATNTVLSEYCIDIEVLLPIKGELVSPRDAEEIRIPYPIFNWMPPSPITPGNQVTYEINIVEILERQTAVYAMSSNPFIFSKKNITNGMFQYPIAAMQLQNGIRYAWQIKTYLNGSLLSESEIREFTYSGKGISSKEFNKQKLNEFKEQSSTFIDFNFNNNKSLHSAGLTGRKKLNLSSPEFIDVGSTSDSPVKFFGSYNITGKISDRQKSGSQVPKDLMSVEFNPGISVYGLPITLNLYFDTQQLDFKQNINSFALLFDPAKLKDYAKGKATGMLKFISGFNTLGIGEVYPSYSKYILNGTKVRGLDLEYNPGLFYIALTGFKNLDAIDSVNFARNLYAGKIGIGAKDNSHFHISVMKAKDNVNSLDINDTLKVTSRMSPMENFIVGTDGAIKLLKDRVTVKGEFSGSVVTDDLRAPDLVSDDIPSIARDFISIKMGTHFDFIYNIQSDVNIPESHTKLKFGYKSIGNGYSSLGAPSITNGLKGFNAGIDQSFLDKKIHLKYSVEALKNDLSSLSKSKHDFSLSMFFEDAPYLILNYTPYSEKNDAATDSLKITNSASVFSLITGFNIPFSKNTLSSMIMLSTQTNQSKKRIGDYTIYNFSLNETFSLDIPVSFSAGMNITAINSVTNDTLTPGNVYNYEFNGTFTLFEMMNNTLGVTLSKTSGLNSNTLLYFNSSLPLWNLGNFILNVQKNFYREDIFEYGDNDDIQVRAGISKSF